MNSFYVRVNIPAAFLVAICHLSQTVSIQNLLD